MQTHTPWWCRRAELIRDLCTVARLVDCYHRGRLISLRDLRKNPGLLSPEARFAIQRPCTLREILQRILTNLQFAFVQSRSDEDIQLIGELLQSLEIAP